MDLGDLSKLWYLTHFANARSIIARGLLSHNDSLQLNVTRIDNSDVNKRRARMLDRGKTLHDYVNLYINPRNGMMFYLTHDGGISHSNLVLFQVSKRIFDRDDILVSDMNAAKDGALIRPWKDILPKLDAKQIFTKYWNDPDDATRKLKMSRMMAEVLVPDGVSADLIIGVSVSCYRTADRAEQLGLPNINVNPGLFFETGAGAKIPWQE